MYAFDELNELEILELQDEKDELLNLLNSKPVNKVEIEDRIKEIQETLDLLY